MVKSMKKWNILSYLAGDNNLCGAAIDDINEMEVVGSTADMDVVVQVDHAADYESGKDDFRSTRRYHITKGKNRNKISSELLGDMGTTNTGDPNLLVDFIREGAERYPAERTMLVLWNHGSGFYVPPEMISREGGALRREINTRGKAALKRSFFSSSREKIFTQPTSVRGILYDDGSSDCLDNKELKDVVARAHGHLGRKLDVIGMDACLMTMIEVAYQVRDHADVLVGSEETEPSQGWPYHTVLADLAKNPAMNSGELGSAIVRRYIESYKTEKSGITQSALDLSKLGDVTLAIDTLAGVLLRKLSSKTERGAILIARDDSTSFYQRMYVDIHDFARNLAEASDDKEVRSACEGVARAIAGNGAVTPIFAEEHKGSTMSRVKGLSIYMPSSWNPSVYYEDLDFAKATRWGKFLNALHHPKR